MNLPPQPPVFSSEYLIELHNLMEKHIKAHAEQYGRLCAEAEREACALACEALSFTPQGPTFAAKHQRQLCANAIRARSQR